MKRIRELSILCLVLLMIFSSCSSTQGEVEEKGRKETSKLQNSQDEQRRKLPTENQKKTFEAQKIENNGGYFVGVDDRIYFQKIKEEEMGQIYDGFVYAFGTQKPVKSQFGYVTKTDKTFVPVMEDMEVHGNIFYMNGMFYFNGKLDDDAYIYQMDMEGKNITALTEGFLDAVYPKGNLCLVQDGKGKHFIYQDMKIVKEINLADKGIAFETVIDEYAIYSVYELKDLKEVVSFYALNLDELGDFVPMGSASDDFGEEWDILNIYVEEIKKIEDKIYAKILYAGGSGKFLAGYEIFSMSWNEPHSLKSEVKLDAQKTEESFIDFAPSMGIVDGKVDFCLMGEGDMIANYDGVFYNQSAKVADDIISHRISEPIEYVSDYMGNSYFPEIVEKVGDEIYYIFDKRRYYMDGGIQRSYFKLMNMEYFCYDTKSKKNTSLFGVVENREPQYAYIWVNEEQEDQHRLMYKMVDLAFTEEQKEELSDLYFGEGVELANGVKVFEVEFATRKSLLSPNLEYAIEGEDSNSEGFKEFYNSMRYRGISRDFSKPNHEENLPSADKNEGDILLAKLYFDSLTEEIIKIEEVKSK